MIRLSSNRIRQTTLKQKENLEIQKELDHHIPAIIIDRISNLNNIHHRKELARFSEEYENKSFKNLEEEYECVRIAISNLLHLSFSNPLTELIKNGMRAGLAAVSMEKDIETSYREHFIHPFQIFLLGTIIIDRFYDLFNQWYEKEGNTSIDNYIESAWLLTAIFHDRAKDVNLLRTILEFEMGYSDNKLPNEDLYLRLISSFQNHKSHGGRLSKWTSGMQENQALLTILEDYSQKWNHGVKGAILMLKHLNENLGSILPRDISAAFAISIHDKQLWSPLQTAGIFPIHINQYPLSCLLLYLDTIHEWGRTTIPDTETSLVNLTINNQDICFEVAFNSHRAARHKLKECELAQNCLFSKPLRLFFSPRVNLFR
jgi:hypothetical protein